MTWEDLGKEEVMGPYLIEHFFDDRSVVVFENGIVILKYHDDETYNEWSVKDDIVKVDTSLECTLWITTKRGLEYYLDISNSQLCLHKK